MSLWIKCGIAVILALYPVTASVGPQKGRSYFESRGEVVWEVKTDEKVVALTFDDGPDPDNTGKILDLMKKHDGKATFFIIGEKAKRSPELVKREYDEGHELANHTYYHSFLNERAYGKIEKGILETGQIISDITGHHCRLFRPPGGMYNEKLIHIAKKHGYTVVLWSWHQDTKDWSRPGVNKIVRRVLDNIHNGDIVLFHEYVQGGSQTVEALNIILPELKKRGYRFVTVSELIGHQKAHADQEPLVK